MYWALYIYIYYIYIYIYIYIYKIETLLNHNNYVAVKRLFHIQNQLMHTYMIHITLLALLL